MNHCHLGEDGAVYIAQGLVRNKTLKTLNIADNNFGDEGLAFFAINLPAYKVANIDLSNNFITDKIGE